MDSEGRVLVANAGTLHVFHTAAELRRHGLLKRCATSLYFRERLIKRLPNVVRERVLQLTINRRCADLDGAVETLPSPEIVYLVAKSLGWGSPGAWIEWRNRRFCVWAAKQCLDGVNLVWAFDTSSYELFEQAKKRGLPCVLEMSIAHPALGQRLMDEYARQKPDLAGCLDRSVSDEAMVRRRAEIDLADRIVVGSNFVRDSLLAQGVSASKITVNPYGVDVDRFPAKRHNDQRHNGLRFLFVGWFSARKGIYDLLDAWAHSGLAKSGSELVLAGGTRGDLACWRGNLPEGVSLEGRVAHSDVPDLYRSADVFVFPSLFEGSARVVLEAASSGLPVITTPEACDEHWVVDGESGFRVAAADSEGLSEKMREIAEDPSRRCAMSSRAAEIGRQYTWSAYGDRCATVCRELVNQRPC